MRWFTGISILLCTLLLVSTSSAQQTSVTSVPNLIRYSGTLKNAETVAISSATIGVTFSIYKQQDGGAPVWMETQNVTTDAGGNYSVLLGSTTATGLPSDLFSQEEQRWLGVQVQGQAEQPRVLLVSVPYAFKAHEAETLAGKSISDFVLAKDLNLTQTAVGAGSSQAASSVSNSSPAAKLGIKTAAASDGPTNFSGSTTDQIVGVTQTGTGAGVYATAPTNVVVGTATAPTGIALYGIANVSNGIGVKGISYSPSGTGVRGTNAAGSGPSTGISAYVGSPAGTAAVFNNAAGGKIISGQNNSAEKFSVDGSGNVTAMGTLSAPNVTAGTVSGSAINTAATYEIRGSSVVGMGDPRDQNLFLGVGAGAGAHNTGQGNVFSGYQAGYSNTDGGGDNFVGNFAGYSNTDGYSNNFFGYNAGYDNTTGYKNTFFGDWAGYYNTTGNYNTFVGVSAGQNNQTGSNDVYIANLGADSGAESNTIRIGGAFPGLGPQTATYIAGIYNSTATPTPPFQVVCVDLTGTLFGTTPGTSCVVSSRRFKEQIADMGDSSSRLFQLRPVTFFYKSQYDDGSHLLQYGLIAEEVAKVYPDMVAYDKDGQPYTVKYQYLAPMLLNELQKQHAVVSAQQDVIRTQQEQIKEMQDRLSRLEALVGK
jgi:trimeric autotransporter adhesin